MSKCSFTFSSVTTKTVDFEMLQGLILLRSQKKPQALESINGIIAVSKELGKYSILKLEDLNMPSTDELSVAISSVQTET